MRVYLIHVLFHRLTQSNESENDKIAISLILTADIIPIRTLFHPLSFFCLFVHIFHHVESSKRSSRAIDHMASLCQLLYE